MNHACQETTYETERLNWYQARQFCQGYGGDLATYSSSTEEDHGLGGAKGHYKGLWFGLERGTDDVFRWVDGTNLNYTNWNYGEPRIRSYKYCASHAPGTGRWELDYCGVRRWFVCKAPKVETPTLPDIKFEKKLCNITTTSVYRQWYLYENHCYLIHDDPKYSWDLAQNFCQDNDAHLASVHSFNETNFILFAKLGQIALRLSPASVCLFPIATKLSGATEPTNGRQKMALEIASSGIADTLFKWWTNAYSAFQLPLDIREKPDTLCNINKKSGMATVWQRSLIIICNSP
ncbi:macrophage mannose receptor 1 [Trichonephila clavipes]|nr:macrophage mannose receptor 1 [Trichonephila clavipes]